MPSEFMARQARAGQPAQEARPLPRMPQGCWRCGAQRAECVSGEHRIERWPRCGWWEDRWLASLAGRTVAAVAAALFAEVAQQGVGLAAGVLDHVDDVLDAGDLLLLAAREARGQIGDEPGDVRTLDGTGKALAHARDLQLEQVLLGQV